MASLTATAPIAPVAAFDEDVFELTGVCMTFLTTRSAMTVTRSLSDGQWCTPAQLCEATGVAPAAVTRVLDCLALGGYLETVGDRLRMDPAGARIKVAALFAEALGH